MTPAALILLHICYPLAFAQTTINTGLIAYKVWMQHRKSQKSGLQVVSGTGGVSLMTVVWILVESAMGYTVLNLVVAILFVVNHKAVIMLQGCIPPFASEYPFSLLRRVQ